MGSFEKFSETQLPPQSAFFGIINDEGTSHEDYEHARKVWKAFGLKTLGDYHDLYLNTDVLIRADVFENFRKTCLEYYGLDPPHYFTTPGFAWDATLHMTKVNLYLLSDIDMHLFIEKGMRGGTSYVAKRYAKANNPYMKDFDETKPHVYIPYLDANNLYGCAMSKPLPTGGFKWASDEQLHRLFTLRSKLLQMTLEE